MAVTITTFPCDCCGRSSSFYSNRFSSTYSSHYRSSHYVSTYSSHHLNSGYFSTYSSFDSTECIHCRGCCRSKSSVATLSPVPTLNPHVDDAFGNAIKTALAGMSGVLHYDFGHWREYSEPFTFGGDTYRLAITLQCDNTDSIYTFYEKLAGDVWVFWDTNGFTSNPSGVTHTFTCCEETWDKWKDLTTNTDHTETLTVTWTGNTCCSNGDTCQSGEAVNCDGDCNFSSFFAAPCECPGGVAMSYSIHIPGGSISDGTNSMTWPTQDIVVEDAGGLCHWNSLTLSASGVCGGVSSDLTGTITTFLFLDTASCSWKIELDTYCVSVDNPRWIKVSGGDPTGSYTGDTASGTAVVS